MHQGLNSSLSLIGRSGQLAAGILLFCGVLLASTSATEFPNADVTGTWDLTVETQEGTAHALITLKQEGEKISGTYKGQIGESNLAGSIKGSEISFSVTLKFQDIAYTVVYSGSVNDDSMKGTARFGATGTGNWTARRRKQ